MVFHNELKQYMTSQINRQSSNLIHIHDDDDLLCTFCTWCRCTPSFGPHLDGIDGSYVGHGKRKWKVCNFLMLCITSPDNGCVSARFWTGIRQSISATLGRLGRVLDQSKYNPNCVKVNPILDLDQSNLNKLGLNITKLYQVQFRFNQVGYPNFWI